MLYNKALLKGLGPMTFCLFLVGCGDDLPERCDMKPDPGPCKARIEKFFYNHDTKSCDVFYYGGCQGTVPFDTLDKCESTCEKKPAVEAKGCEFEGTHYALGESWPVDCNTCTCVPGEGLEKPHLICTEIACANATLEHASQADYPYDVNLNVGDSIATPAGEITFESVEEDSRCPTDGVCAWEGNAKVTLQLQPEDGAPVTLVLDTAQKPELQPTTSFNDIRFRIKSLSPQPQTNKPIEAQHYQLELAIDQPNQRAEILDESR